MKAAWKVKAIISAEGPHPTCIVQEVSSGAVRLLVAKDARLPDRFSLYVPLKDETHDVEVSWRDEEASEVGVSFLGPADRVQSQAPLDPHTRIGQLDAHIVHLEDQIQRMESRISTLMERVTRLEFP